MITETNGSLENARNHRNEMQKEADLIVNIWESIETSRQECPEPQILQELRQYYENLSVSNPPLSPEHYQETYNISEIIIRILATVDSGITPYFMGQVFVCNDQGFTEKEMMRVFQVLNMRGIIDIGMDWKISLAPEIKEQFEAEK